MGSVALNRNVDNVVDSWDFTKDGWITYGGDLCGLFGKSDWVSKW